MMITRESYSESSTIRLRQKKPTSPPKKQYCGD